MSDLRTAHPVYPGGPPCNPYCEGEWSTYHDGYGDGYEAAERAALASREERAGLDVERLTVALWGMNFDKPDASKLARRIAREYDRLSTDTPEAEPAGTRTDCPLKGVHEHAFRGPHSFREWLP